MLRKKKSGFTLIEMIIVVTLITVVLGIISSIFITGNKVFSDSDVKSTLQIEAQAIQEKISAIGMEANSITSINPRKVIINSYDKDENEQSLEIKKENNFISITTYDKDGNEVSSEVLSENVNKLEIAGSANSINVDLELTKKNVIYPINFTITFRNKGLN